ncbi:MAG: lamin tail domain-containing protein [Candidatus Nanopelagicales bacterium]
MIAASAGLPAGGQAADALRLPSAVGVWTRSETLAVSRLAASTLPLLDARVKVSIRLNKQPKKSQRVLVSLNTRVGGKAHYTARISFGPDRKARLQHLASDASGRLTTIGREAVLVTTLTAGGTTYFETEVIEGARGTSLRTRGWKRGKKSRAKTLTALDSRSGRLIRPGTSRIEVVRKSGARKPTVRQLSVSQPRPMVNTPKPSAPAPAPTPTATPGPPASVPTATPSPAAGVPSATPSPPATIPPPNPNAGHKSWLATVARVVDGDTLEVRLDSNPTELVKIRNAGIQAMEVGECHYDRAKASMAALAPPGSRVLLSARFSTSTSYGDGLMRPLRLVYVLQGGKWVDTQLVLLQQGEVLWYPIPSEYDHSTAYRRAMELAGAAQLGMFSPARACGSSSVSAAPRMWINFDGDGDENTDVNSEYVRVHNSTSAPLDLSGWWVRDGSQVVKAIPNGVILRAGGLLTVHVGRGTDNGSAGRLHWGFTSPRYQNTVDGSTGRRVVDIHGNAAYLFDVHGNLRAFTTYPCETCGTHTLHGRVKISVHPQGADEYVTVQNISASTIDLSFQDIQSRGSVHELPAGSYLNAGETLTVHMRTGATSRLDQYWGKAGLYNLPDAGGEIRLKDARDVQAACVAWGAGVC